MYKDIKQVDSVAINNVWWFTTAANKTIWLIRGTDINTKKVHRYIGIWEWEDEYEDVYNIVKLGVKTEFFDKFYEDWFSDWLDNSEEWRKKVAWDLRREINDLTHKIEEQDKQLKSKHYTGTLTVDFKNKQHKNKYIKSLEEEVKKLKKLVDADEYVPREEYEELKRKNDELFKDITKYEEELAEQDARLENSVDKENIFRSLIAWYYCYIPSEWTPTKLHSDLEDAEYECERLCRKMNKECYIIWPIEMAQLQIAWTQDNKELISNNKYDKTYIWTQYWCGWKGD